MEILGRQQDLHYLRNIWESKDPVFLSVYGRRRVGKTYLITEFFNDKGIFLSVTGTEGGTLTEQLQNFYDAFIETFQPAQKLAQPKSWREAFNMLLTEIRLLPKNKKIVIFLDELPWLASKRSRLLSSIDYFWNRHFSRMPNVKLVVCGSAAFWMLDKIINAKGGLYNRVTHVLYLPPFNLYEAKQFLQARGINYTNKQLIEIYMVMGGIPHYLKHLKKSKSAAQNINEICFRKNGILLNEFKRLFKALFSQAELSAAIVRALAKSQNGMGINKLLECVNKPSGGTFTQRLEELVASGFIQRYVPYGKKSRETFYRVVDEYSLFYLNWIEALSEHDVSITNVNHWLKECQTPRWNAWSGYAFENICLKHLDKILERLDLLHVPCKVGSWRYLPPKGSGEQGAQIDLLIDRGDGVITLCEMKYSNNLYQLDKQSASNIANKIRVFEKHFTTNKMIEVVLITTHGMKPSIWAEGLISDVITLDDLVR